VKTAKPPDKSAAKSAAAAAAPVGLAAAKKSLKDVGKNVQQMKSGLAGIAALKRSKAAAEAEAAAAEAASERQRAAAEATAAEAAAPSALPKAGTPGSMGADNMTQFFEENGEDGGPPRGILLGQKGKLLEAGTKVRERTHARTKGAQL
jgi:septal ring factor EnvC (AmiA/AmiB activator)